MSKLLGIEIGGTKLQIGIGSGNGRIDHLWRGSVDLQQGGEGIRNAIVAGVSQILVDAQLSIEQIQAIGIGFGGPVDDATGCTITSHQVSGWDAFPLTQWAERQFHRPTFIGNDSDLAGLAEASHGAGAGLSPVFYMNIGSGIGGALLIDQQIYRGTGRGASEIGHLKLDPSNDTILEHQASGWAIARRAASDPNLSTVAPILFQMANGIPDAINAVMVGKAAERGDEGALAYLHEAWTVLAVGICHVIALLCPHRIIIGGGVSLMGEKLLMEPLRKMVDARVMQAFRGCTEIVPAALGEEVVVHGALAIARQNLAEPESH